MHHPHVRLPRFAVVIPSYNHGERIAGVLQGSLLLGYPVVVVDDGSTDATIRIVKSFSGVELISHPVNQGKGAALITGMRAVADRADYVITIDADGQHDPSDAHRLVAALDENHRSIVLGRRDMTQAPWTSRKGRAFSNFWVWISGGPKVVDSQSGFRVYPLPETLQLGVAARRYQFEVEVLVRAAWRGISVVEAPVSAAYGVLLPRISHFRPGVDFMRNFRAFARLITRRVFTPSLWFTKK